MNERKSHYWLSIPILALLLGSAVAQEIKQPSAPVATEAPKYSGFLRQGYQDLKETNLASGNTVLRWHAPALEKSFGNYRAVIVDRVVFYPKPAPNNEVSATTLKSIRDYLTVSLKKEISRHLPIVDKPAPGVLRLSAAVTAVDSKMQGLQIRELLPIALVFSAVKAAAGARTREATIAFEWELIDSSNGKIMAKGVRQGVGNTIDDSTRKITFDSLQPALNAWVKDTSDGFAELAGAQAKNKEWR